MPKVRKLSVEEVQTIERKNKGQRKMVEEQYDSFLEGYDIGDYGEAELEEDEKRITVRNRLKAAAVRRDVELEFRRTKGDTLRFRVVATDGSTPPDTFMQDDEDEEVAISTAEPYTPAASIEDHPITPKRRGRRKKSEM